jgi:aminoglycoside phosphotransferase (APT) family kinase protein
MADSQTKARLSEAEIDALTRQAFDGRGTRAVRELTEGYFNIAYRVDLEDGEALVLKVAPPADVPVLTYEHDLMRGEVEAMRLAAADARVPAPAMRFADFTRSRLPVDYLFMDLVDGVSWSSVRVDLNDVQNAEIERQLSVISAAINSRRHPTFGYLATGPGFGSWLEAFGWMCASLYADAARFGISVSLPEVELQRLLERHGQAFDAVTRPCLVHWDLWAGNVLVRLGDDHPQITGVIDFERAMWADPLMEFIPGRLHDIEAYESGYGRPLLSTRAERIRRLFYNVYLGLVLVVEDGPRQYHDKATVEWGGGLLERAAAMLDHGDVIEDLLTYA